MPTKTSKRSKRKQRAIVTRRVATGVAASAAVGLAVAGVARAARNTERVMPKLPAPGATVEVELSSRGVELEFSGRRVKTGPLHGRATYDIEENRGDPSSVRTRVRQFYLTSPPEQGGVTITVEPATARDREELSVLRLAGPGASKFQHTLALTLNVIVPNPRELGIPHGSEKHLSMTVVRPVALLGKSSAFPQSGTVYRLDEKTPLAAPGRPEADVASIVRFPVKVEGL